MWHPQFPLSSTARGQEGEWWLPEPAWLNDLTVTQQPWPRAPQPAESWRPHEEQRRCSVQPLAKGSALPFVHGAAAIPRAGGWKGPQVGYSLRLQPEEPSSQCVHAQHPDPSSKKPTLFGRACSAVCHTGSTRRGGHSIEEVSSRGPGSSDRGRAPRLGPRGPEALAPLVGFLS